MVKDHIFIVFGAEHYNPLTVIRSLGKNGINPVFIAIKNKGPVASKSRYIEKCHHVESIEEGYDVLIREYGELRRKPFLLTTDDDVQSYLDSRYAELANRFYFFNAGKAGRITEFMDKKNVLDLAARHGLNVLPTIVVDHGVVPDDLMYPILTKSISPNVGGWKKDVHICNNAKELKEAYSRILSPRVLIQQYLDKKNEYTIDGFSVDRGRQVFAPLASEYNYLLPGYYSPFMTFFPVNKREILESCKEVLAEVGYEGIFDFEFLIDKDDTLFFTEINFRNNPFNYCATKLNMPFPVLWAESMLNGRIDCEKEKVYVPSNYMAMIEPVDYGKRVETGMIELGEWIYDFKRTQCPFYYDEVDKEPFLEMVRNWKMYC